MESSSKKSKNSQNNPIEVKTNALPDEHRVMKTLLEELGVTDYDPQVVTQMLDFSYSYLTDILSDSHTFAKHANRSAVDLEDVKLATQFKHEKAKKGSSILPDRTRVSNFARTRNQKKLEPPKSQNNNLPANRFCYNEENYQMKDSNKIRAEMNQQNASNINNNVQNNNFQQPGPEINNYSAPNNYNMNH